MLNAAIISSAHFGNSIKKLLRETNLVFWNGICITGEAKRDSPNHVQTSAKPELLAKISDLLIVLDPDYCSYDYLSHAVRNGCHLFLTDRLNMTTNERNKLIELADEGGTAIQVRNDLLFHPFRDVINPEPAIPTFIDIHQVAPNQSVDYQEIVFNNLLMTLSIAGSQVHRLNVFGATGSNDKTSLINLHISFTNGSAASITISFTGKTNEHQLSIYKNGKSLKLDFGKEILTKTSSNPNISSGNDPLNEQIYDFIQKISANSIPFFSLKDEATAFHLLEKIKLKLEARSVLI